MYMSDMSPELMGLGVSDGSCGVSVVGLIGINRPLEKTSLSGLLAVGNGQLLADSGFGGGGEECQIDYSRATS